MVSYRWKANKPTTLLWAVVAVIAAVLTAGTTLVYAAVVAVTMGAAMAGPRMLGNRRTAPRRGAPRRTVSGAR